ncbi:MAG: hypothetical protein ACR65R_07530 [Methylomicrobium sp.]
MIQTIIQFSNNASWFANLLGILGFFGSCFAVFYRFIRPHFQATRIESILPRDFEQTWSPLRAKFLARIAIVDDQPNDFPIEELKSDGYQVNVYQEATLAITTQLAAYDIVFLDMKGIVRDDPEFGGLKLIAELRNANPTQKICAVSSKTFDPTATEFFRQANDYKKKPLTAQECRSVIDAFLIDLFPLAGLVSGSRDALDLLLRTKRVTAIKAIKSFTANAFGENVLAQRLYTLGLTKAQALPLINLARAISHASR